MREQRQRATTSQCKAASARCFCRPSFGSCFCYASYLLHVEAMLGDRMTTERMALTADMLRSTLCAELPHNWCLGVVQGKGREEGHLHMQARWRMRRFWQDLAPRTGRPKSSRSTAQLLPTPGTRAGKGLQFRLKPLDTVRALRRSTSHVSRAMHCSAELLFHTFQLLTYC